MSDFLNQFENDTYKKKDLPQKAPCSKLEGGVPSAPLESAPTPALSARSDQENGQTVRGIKSEEHETVIDSAYHKRKLIRYSLMAAGFVLLAAILFFAYRYLNSVKVISFVGQNLSEAQTWAVKNKIELETQYVFSTKTEANIIISQDKAKNSSMQKGDPLTVTVSKGADPNERIIIPDLTKMNTAEINDWINENKLNNTNVIQEYNDAVAVNQFLRKVFNDIGVDDTNFKRKNYLTIYVSKGKQEVEKDITVPDFTNKAKTAADAWADDNAVTLVYTEAASDTVQEGFIISQDIPQGNMVASKDTIQLKVSVGKGVKVPDFSNISENDAATIEPLLTVRVTTRYSDTVPYGKLISQSIKANQLLFGKDNIVSVVYSEGRPYIDNLVGMSEKDIAPTIYKLTEKGAHITYAIIYVDSAVQKGTVVWASKSNEFISTSTPTNIEIHVSKGNLTASAPAVSTPSEST